MKPAFSLEYFRRARVQLLADDSFLKSIDNMHARFSIEGLGKRFLLIFSGGAFEVFENDEPSDAGIRISDKGWQKLVGGARTELLVLTRRIRLQGDYMRYTSYLDAIRKILGVIQSGADLPALLSTPEPERKPASQSSTPPIEPPRSDSPSKGNGSVRQLVDAKPRSKTIFEDNGLPLGLVRLSILKGLGIDQAELRSKPFIGIANSWAEMNPGHKHLRELAEEVKAGVLAAGGIPFEFNVPAPCDCIGNGNDGMRYVLAQRDLIADIIECYARSHWFDGLVTISSCDKINPGMLMAAGRLDIPALCVPGGSNAWNVRFTRRNCCSVDNKDYEDLGDKLETATAATCGACEIMGTANTIQCLMEALGMALPRSGAIPAFHADRGRLARLAGKRAVEMVGDDLRPSQILTRRAFENAVMVHLAIGGSTNTTLHLPAIAAELGIELPLELFNMFNRRVPTLCGITPNGPNGVMDFYFSGGVQAVLKQLEGILHKDCLTVTGETIGDWLERARVADAEVIRPMDEPFLIEGCTAVLYGNLAPRGAVIKQSSVMPSMHQFAGEAICFDSEAEALEGIMSDRIRAGHVVVIRYEGPKGAPGMPELLSVTAILDVMNIAEVALVTDGRFSGATHGPCIGHVAPEASEGGPIALVRDGDRIEIDIADRSLRLCVSDAELDRRRAVWRPVDRPVARGYLSRYRRWVGSAERGARMSG